MLLLTMHVRVLPFGILKDSLGPAPAEIDLAEGSTVGDLLSLIDARFGAHSSMPVLRGIAVSVNAEYATAEHILRDNDEVGLLPPVSGGAAAAHGGPLDESSAHSDTVALTRDPIDAQPLIAAAKHPDYGAVVVFDGIVRNNTRGRATLHLDYEAYEEMAMKQMRELVEQGRARFGVHSISIVHRLGRLEIGETSVLIVVASAHRAAAFDACRWLIDTLKKTVPIWKRETFADGAVWAPGEPFPAELAVAQPETAHG